MAYQKCTVVTKKHANIQVNFSLHIWNKQKPGTILINWFGRDNSTIAVRVL